MKYILILLFAFFGLPEASSQDENDRYLFSDFMEGYVYYKDGRTFQVPLNYDLLINKFYFIDKDNEKKDFSDPDMVVSIRIGKRTFCSLPGNEMAEVIQANPKILIRYTGTKKIKKNLTYGGETETASVDSYTNLIYGTGDNTLNIQVDKIEYDFYLETDNRLRRFATRKQFLKFFSRQKDELIRYMDENKTDFRSIEQVVQLCNYAFSVRE